MKQQHTQSGYSLVEALVAISVLLIAIVGPMTIAAQGIKSSQFSLEQNTAFFLAQEGIEAVFAIRNNYAVADVKNGLDIGDPDTSWDWLDDNFGSNSPCSNGFSTCSFGIDFSSSDVASTITGTECIAPDFANCRLYNDGGAPAVFHLSGTDESPYTRVVTINVISPQSVEVVSTVRWKSHVFGGQEQNVKLTTYLFDSNYENP